MTDVIFCKLAIVIWILIVFYFLSLGLPIETLTY